MLLILQALLDSSFRWNDEVLRIYYILEQIVSPERRTFNNLKNSVFNS